MSALANLRRTLPRGITAHSSRAYSTALHPARAPPALAPRLRILAAGNQQRRASGLGAFADGTRVETRAISTTSPLSRQPPRAAVNDEPTESEEDVAADRSGEDPLPPEKHNVLKMPAGEAAPRPTESEADVTADRDKGDPLKEK